MLSSNGYKACVASEGLIVVGGNQFGFNPNKHALRLILRHWGGGGGGGGGTCS